MNSFLQKQLDKKIEKFFEGKDDAFLVAVTRWLSFGDGPSTTPPEGVSQEEFNYLVKEIVGESALAHLIYEIREKPQIFSRMSGSEKAHLSYLNNFFLSECYFRLQKRVHVEKMEKIAKDVKEKQDALKKTCKGLKKTLTGTLTKIQNDKSLSENTRHDSEKNLTSLIEMVDEAIKTQDYSKLLQ
jgi:hypothetical protein